MLTDRHGQSYRDDRQADGPRRLARGRLAGRVRRARPRRGGAADLRQRGGPRRRSAAVGHPADRRPDPAGVRHRRSRRSSSCRGSWPARCISRSATPSRSAGTDLAALRTRAVRDGDSYVVNGQKIFTTGGHDADYIWLACRTDPDAPRHKGISILIVDTTDPGFSWTPIITCDGAHHVNATYYSDVRVPVTHAGRGGERGLAAGDHPAQPRAGDARPGRPDRRAVRPGARLGRARRPARTAGRCSTSRTCGGRWPGHAQPARQRAAELAGRGRRLRCDIADASATKVFASERVQRLGQVLEEVVGTARRPGRRAHGRADPLAGHPGQAQHRC